MTGAGLGTSPVKEEHDSPVNGWDTLVHRVAGAVAQQVSGSGVGKALQSHHLEQVLR